MTELLFRTDPYLAEAEATLVGQTQEGGLILDRTVFYPTGGGQPGDSGTLDWEGGTVAIATAVKTGEDIALIPQEGQVPPPLGAGLRQRLDWTRRHRHMRVHTALHLLSVVIPLPVTGGQVRAEGGRLDFDMPEPPADPAALEEELNTLISRDLMVTEDWITDAELQANPELVKTMSVNPPKGQGRVRLIRIGTDAEQVDLQPCGGTHVARTAEIGHVKISRIQKKGRQNRRVAITLPD
ncbi:MAG: alanyl-tRNA editing protein [Pseudorhodobacter sp.]